MLIRFSVENYLSFGARAEFSTVATREMHHRDRTYSAGPDGLRLLPVSVLFGPNASGKSNLFRALQFLRGLVVDGVRPEAAIPVTPFRLDPALRTAPSRFEIEFLSAGTAFAYEVTVTSSRVLEESLSRVRPSGKVLLFQRKADPDRPSFIFENELTGGDSKEWQFLAFVGMGTRSNELFLHQALDRAVESLKPAFEWFSKILLLLDPRSVSPAMVFQLAARDDFRSFCSDSVRRIGAGIESIEPEVLPIKDSTVPELVREEAMRRLTDVDGVLMGTRDGQRFSFSKVNGEVQVARVVSYHPGTDGERVCFEFSEESEGTQRFMDLLPALYNLGRPNHQQVVFVDELDRSLHSGLTRSVVESYLQNWLPGQTTQFLFTSHDATLLDQDLFRRDEVWLLEKTDRGDTEIRSLGDYRVRTDKRLMKDYLQGRFGAVPRTRRLAMRRPAFATTPHRS